MIMDGVNVINVGIVAGMTVPSTRAVLTTPIGGVSGGTVAGGSPNNGVNTWQEAGINPGEAQRIQNAANRTGQQITVVGSRAEGTATAASDWDYIMSGNSSARHSVRSSVPSGMSGGEINAPGIDVWQDYNPNAINYTTLDSTKPHVIFTPLAK
ncbi:MAG: hypothetical protein R6V06_03415 [Kiritimatiellia bacterium]